MMYIGATVDFNRHLFHLTDADEFTLNYMESHATEYPKANIKLIMSKIRKVVEPIYKEFIDKYLEGILISEDMLKPTTMKLCCYTTAMALRDILGKDITEHEITTFLRYFDADQSPKQTNTCCRSTIQSMIQIAMATNFWDDNEELQERIYTLCPVNRTDFVPQNIIWTVLKSCRVPIKDILITNMLSVYVTRSLAIRLKMIIQLAEFMILF